MSKSTVYLAIVAIAFAARAIEAQDFDPEAISQVSKAIAEQKLMSDSQAEERQVYVSSSLSPKVDSGTGQGINTVVGLSAFGEDFGYFAFSELERQRRLMKSYDFRIDPSSIQLGELNRTLKAEPRRDRSFWGNVVSAGEIRGEYRPVRTAMNYYYRRRDMILESIKQKPQFWFWKGCQASGYDFVGKYIEHFGNLPFPSFSPLAIEDHTVIALDPRQRYTTFQQIGAGVQLAGDIGAPFASKGLKTMETNLLKRRADAALRAESLIEFDKAVTQLYRSMVFADRGLRTYDTTKNLNKAYNIGSDAFNLSGWARPRSSYSTIGQRR